MVTRIVVPLDGSMLAETVLPYVKQLGAAMRWPVELLRVVEPPRERVAQKAAGETVATAAARYLERVKDYFKGSACSVTVRVAVGIPAVEIIEASKANPETLVAMSTHGKSGVTRWLIGSVAGKVLHYSAGPLLLIRPRPRSPIAPEPRFRSLVVPLDGSALAEQVLPQVAPLAKAMDLTVMLVRVTPSLADYYRWDSEASGYANYSQVAEAVDRDAEKYLGEAAARLRSVGVPSLRTTLAHGDAAAAINDAAAQMDDSLVAMTTRGHTGLARTVLGSVADRVVRHGGPPVWLVRPAQEA